MSISKAYERAHQDQVPPADSVDEGQTSNGPDSLTSGKPGEAEGYTVIPAVDPALIEALKDLGVAAGADDVEPPVEEGPEKPTRWYPMQDLLEDLLKYADYPPMEAVLRGISADSRSGVTYGFLNVTASQYAELERLHRLEVNRDLIHTVRSMLFTMSHRDMDTLAEAMAQLYAGLGHSWEALARAIKE